MTRRFETSGAPFRPPPRSVASMMFDVLVALVPGVLAHVWFFGPGILIQIAIASTAALAFEAAALKIRGRAMHPYLFDGSAVITAVLYALCLPPLMPWYVAVIAMFFAIVIAKHLYGGLGYNLFNPAMVGYAVAIISFPVFATAWLAPSSLVDEGVGLVDSLAVIFAGSGGQHIDAITEATPLDRLRTGVRTGVMISEIRADPIFGDFGGRGWEWIANFYALGGIYLLWRRTISWHVPVAMLGVVAMLTLPGYAMDPDSNPFPLQHIFTGGLVLGAFFVATDPVSGPTTPRGRLLFGAAIGVLTLIIRRWGGYPDGVAFAVLIMNIAVPLIDRFTRPRVFGT